MKDAKIIAMKVKVQASSFHELSEADIALSSQDPSCSILDLVASNFVNSTCDLSCAFFYFPSIQVLAKLATGPIIAVNIISPFDK